MNKPDNLMAEHGVLHERDLSTAASGPNTGISESIDKTFRDRSLLGVKEDSEYRGIASTAAVLERALGGASKTSQLASNRQQQISLVWLQPYLVNLCETIAQQISTSSHQAANPKAASAAELISSVNALQASLIFLQLPELQAIVEVLNKYSTLHPVVLGSAILRGDTDPVDNPVRDTSATPNFGPPVGLESDTSVNKTTHIDQPLIELLKGLALFLTQRLHAPHLQPLALYPALNDLNLAIKAFYNASLPAESVVSESLKLQEVKRLELFFPTFDIELPELSGKSLGEAELLNERKRFERGLLNYLKNPQSVGALQEMAQAVQVISQVSSAYNWRKFWYTVEQLLIAMHDPALALDPSLKLLLARLHQQLRRISETQHSEIEHIVSDVLLREVLLFIACADDRHEKVALAQQALGIDKFIAKGYLSEAAAAPDSAAKAQEGLIQELKNNLIALETTLEPCLKQSSALDSEKKHVLAGFFAQIASGLGFLGQDNAARAVQQLRQGILQIPEKIDSADADLTSIPFVPEGTGFASEDFGMQSKAQNVDGSLTPSRLCNAAMRPQDRSQDSIFGGEGYKVNLTNLTATPDMPVQPAALGEHPLRSLVESIAALGFFIDSLSWSGISWSAESWPTMNRPTKNGPNKVGQLACAWDQSSGRFTVDFGLLQTPGRLNASLFESFESGNVFPKKSDPHAAAADNDVLLDDTLTIPTLGQPQQRDTASAGTGTSNLDLSDASHQDSQSLWTEALDFNPSSAEQHAVPSVQAAPATPSYTASATSDQELLEIFLEEAVEVLDCIDDACKHWRLKPDEREHLTTLKRSFHTLKGSGRMVGLYALGDPAGAMEDLLLLWLSQGRQPQESLYELIQISTKCIRRWFQQATKLPLEQLPSLIFIQQGCELLEQDETNPDLYKLLNHIDDASEQEPLALHQESTQQLYPTLPAHPQTRADKPSLSVADLVNLRPSEIINFDIPALGSNNQTSDENLGIRQIGHLRIPQGLYNIYLSESEDLVNTLERHFQLWRQSPQEPVSELLLRSAHSLAGISATLGLEAVHGLALSIDSLLRAAIRDAVPFNETEFDVLLRAVDQLRSMLHRFAAMIYPEPDQKLMAEIETLRVQLAARALAMPVRPHLGDTQLIDLSLVRDELDQDLLPVFLEEASDAFPTLVADLRKWRKSPQDTSIAQHLLRTLHTAKGGARMAGAMRLGQVLHEMETRVEAAMAMHQVNDTVLDDLISAYDMASHLLDLLRVGKEPDMTALLSWATDFMPVLAPQSSYSHQLETTSLNPASDLHHDDQLPTGNTAQDTLTSPLPHSLGLMVADSGVPLDPSSTIFLPQQPELANPANVNNPNQVLRVRADLIDRLVNQAGEVSITRSRIETEFGSLRGSLVELTDNLSRLRSQLREIEIQADSQMASRREQLNRGSQLFDPLEFDRFTRFQELTRMMAESVDDVATVQHSLLRGLDTAGRDLSAQARLARELQQDLMRVRMVQFGSIAERLYRVARQAAKESDKRFNLDIRGAQVEIDRSVLERMVGPFEHLLRNALVHGIEPRHQRLAQGKSESGEIVFSVRQEGNEVIIEVVDDGAGLDYERIRAKAISRRMLLQDQPYSERQLAELIFQPGLSTMQDVTELAGRGVGMDVVRAEVGALGGRVGIESKSGLGCRFTIVLPLTLTTTHVVLVRVADRLYAIPGALVEQIQQVKPQELAECYSAGYISWMGNPIPIYFLAYLLGQTEEIPKAQRYTPVIILRSGNDRVAVHVDSITANQEVVVKNTGPLVARMVGIAGASVLASGDVVLMLNPIQLVQRAEYSGRKIMQPVVTTLAKGDQIKNGPAPLQTLVTHSNNTGTASNHRAGVAGSVLETLPTVMVVDDSLTVRRVTQRLLERQGYQVILAKDGVEALRQLQDYSPDVMLLDIEMPRMDGFDLTRHIRSDERLKNVPIIMITSRTAEKHRNFAKEIGVNIYLGKPYKEEELIQHISDFLAQKKLALRSHNAPVS